MPASIITSGVTPGQRDPLLGPLAERLEAATARARRLGLDRLELRYAADHNELVRARADRSTLATLARGEPEVQDELRVEAGLAARAFVGGAIGHAARATPRWGEGGEAVFDAAIDELIDEVIGEARARARAQAAVEPCPILEAEEEPARGHHEVERAAEPADRRAFVRELTQRLLAAAGDEGRSARAHTLTFTSERAFASSEGARQTQRLRHAGGGMTIVVEAEGEREERSHPTMLEGGLSAGGRELVRGLDLDLGLVEATAALAEEARALVRAPRCPAGRTSVLLSPEQLGLQIYETVGRPLEGDRILGEERSMTGAGTGASFVTPEMLGRFRYGSVHVNLVADARLPGAIGSFGWDDEGVPARRTPLVQRGQLVGVLSTRRIAARFGLPRSSGCLRAASFRDLPILRMTNVVLEPDPRGPTLEELIADTADGILLGSYRSGSLDGHGLRFEFGCELAWEIRGGKRTRLLRRPLYRGRTPSFWGGCDAVGRPDAVRVLGLEGGKGQPEQRIASGHGGPPARFRDVEIGALPAD